MMAVLGGAAGWCMRGGYSGGTPAGKACLHVFSLAVNNDAKTKIFLNVCCVLVFCVFSVCLFLYVPFCHGAIQDAMSIF